MFITNAIQTEQITNLQTAIANNNEKVEQLEELVNTFAGDIQDLKDNKLDSSEFEQFEENYQSTISGIQEILDELQPAVAELQSCCEAVQGVIGNPENYEQPIYQTLQDFETHTQAMNRDFDGGDLDESVELIEVPNVVGKAASVANLLLGQVGFFTEKSYGGGSYDDSIVISQLPEAGSHAVPGSVVTIFIVTSY